ncbi:hypothetical protein OGATHE_001776 [Ogataea polymorpha]|uniref:Uncharacterized protein n=1 Tax=Ogataea polymorpha TaxID=460523 RepID=A0A9P8PKQ1_9ASCO|nr:hypothetical protein OGATHE_001776 [Ogataea polymorpha]
MEQLAVFIRQTLPFDSLSTEHSCWSLDQIDFCPAAIGSPHFLHGPSPGLNLITEGAFLGDLTEFWLSVSSFDILLVTCATLSSYSVSSWIVDMSFCRSSSCVLYILNSRLCMLFNLWMSCALYMDDVMLSVGLGFSCGIWRSTFRVGDSSLRIESSCSTESSFSASNLASKASIDELASSNSCSVVFMVDFDRGVSLGCNVEGPRGGVAKTSGGG